jgi:hypothetical protein
MGAFLKDMTHDFSKLTYVAMVGYPGCGKTTCTFLSVFFMLGGNLEKVQKPGGVTYFENSHVFYPGRNTSNIADLSTYHICYAENYYKMWLDKKSPSEFFFGERDQMCCPHKIEPLMEAGVKLVVLEFKASDNNSSDRREHRERGLPTKWKSIAANYKLLLCHPKVILCYDFTINFFLLNYFRRLCTLFGLIPNQLW